MHHDPQARAASSAVTSSTEARSPSPPGTHDSSWEVSAPLGKAEHNSLTPVYTDAGIKSFVKPQTTGTGTEKRVDPVAAPSPDEALQSKLVSAGPT
jgi:hypothetical protein